MAENKFKYAANLARLKRIISEATGFDWRTTSFIRDAPSHRDGIAIDLAPKIPNELKKNYGQYMTPKRDPMLHKRPLLKTNLSSIFLAANYPKHRAIVGHDFRIYIENNHLHVVLINSSIIKPGVFLAPRKQTDYYHYTENEESLVGKR